MKKVLFTLGVLMMTAFCNAQSLKLINTDGQIHNGDTVRYDTTLISIAELAALDVKIINTSSSGVAVNLVKQNLYEVTGTENSFCFCINCYPPFVMSAGPCTLNAQDTMTDFSAHYYPYSNCGTSYVAYTFSLNGTPTDSIRVVFEFVVICPGIDEHDALTCKVSNLFPNPASSESRLQYSLNRYTSDLKLKVYSITGELVYERFLQKQNGEAVIPTSEFSKGMYYCTLEGEGAILSSRKLIVN
ncbi:MAG: T9SS type A sorting domain-containing protein [Bacteroidota bacterium]